MSAPPSNEEPARLPLSLQIRRETQHQHVLLNRLVTARLPLCIPPQTERTDLYVAGIQVFGQIYIAFEEAFREWRKKEDGFAGLPWSLDHLWIPNLERADRLEHDLHLLRQRCFKQPPLSTETERWTQQIRENISTSPHLVLAYQWIMYMALFNGGRWMRGEFHRPGPDFWQTTPRRPDDLCDIDCLSFWDFVGDDHDGNEIKEDFRKRFESVAAGLSEQQCREVVEEASAIFEMCMDMVGLLDDVVISRAKPPPPPPPSSEWPLRGVVSLMVVALLAWLWRLLVVKSATWSSLIM